MSQAVATVPKTPTIYTRDGELLTCSVDVANYFEVGHRTIMSAVERRIGDGCLALYRKTSIGRQMPKGGVAYSDAYEMVEAGFVLVAMGLTTPRARSYQMSYMAEFNRMRDELARRNVILVPDLNDPSTLRNMLIGYTDKVIALEAKVEAARPAVEFAERVSTSSLAVCLSDACKILDLAPKAGIARIADMGLVFRRTPGGAWVATQRYIDRGWLRSIVVDRGNFRGLQTVVTGKGLVGIAGKLGSSLTELEIHNRLSAMQRQPDLLTAH